MTPRNRRRHRAVGGHAHVVIGEPTVAVEVDGHADAKRQEASRYGSKCSSGLAVQRLPDAVTECLEPLCQSRLPVGKGLVEHLVDDDALLLLGKSAHGCTSLAQRRTSMAMQFPSLLPC